MDHAKFFAGLRARGSGVFGTSLSQPQVDGINAILAEALRRGTPRSHLAYMLATSYHETGHKMQPNVENLNYTSAARIRAVWPSRFPTVESAAPYVRNPRGLANKVYNGRMGNRVGTDDGWNYRGRGLPHLTGRDNYHRASQKTGVDLISNPDRALELPIAVKVLFDGMGEGWFTGQRMSQHLDKTPPDYVNARRIVNALDKANDIAGHARAFDKALADAGYSGRAASPAPVRPSPAPTPAPKPQAPPAPAHGGLTGVIIVGLLGAGAAALHFLGFI